MDVAFVAFDRSSSGIASYTLELVKLLSKHVNCTLISLDKPDEELDDIKVIWLRSKIKSRALPILNYLINRKLVSKILQDFDLIHETLPPWGSDASKFVTTRWGYVSYYTLALIRTKQLGFPENLGGLPVTLQNYLLDKKSQRNASYIIDVSRESPNFIPPVVEPRPLKSYGESSILKILFVSRSLNMPRKNLKVVFEALRYTKRQVELHLIGHGSIKKYSNCKIITPGYLPRGQLLSYMRNMDLLIMPSTYEEIGFVGLEAYSVGLPVITSNIPSFIAIFKPSPKFPPNDPKTLAKILDTMDGEKLKELGEKSWEYLRSTNEIAKTKILKIYKEISS